jgi:site-specific recombinase XerD
MRRYCAANDRLKRHYFFWLEETKCFAPRTMDAITAALARFEEWCEYRDFRDFDFREAQLQLARLSEYGRALGLAPATIEKKKRLVWAFFAWLWRQKRSVVVNRRRVLAPTQY